MAQYIFIFYIVKEEVRDKAQINKILWALILGAVLASSNGIFQVLTGRDFIRGYQPILNIGLLRATAAFKDANILGIYLSAIVPLILGLGLYYFQGDKKGYHHSYKPFSVDRNCLDLFPAYIAGGIYSLIIFRLSQKSKALLSFLLIFTLASPFLLPKSVKEWAKEVEYNPLTFYVQRRPDSGLSAFAEYDQGPSFNRRRGQYLYEKL